MSATRIGKLAQTENLKGFIAGAVNQGLQSDASFLAPIVPVGSTQVKYWAYDRTAPFRIADTKRAHGGRANRVDFGGTETTVALEPQALDTGIDVTLNDDASIIMDLQSQAALASSQARLSHFATALAVIQAAMTANSVTTTLDISSDDSVEILNTICKGIILSAGGGAAGRLQIRFLWGWNAAQKVLADADVIARISGGSDSSSPATADLGVLKKMLLYPNTMHRMATAVKDTSEQGGTESRAFVLDDEVLIVAASEMPNKQDPSAFKTFWNGAGGVMRERYYPSEDKRVENFGLDWDYKVVSANALASRRVTVQA